MWNVSCLRYRCANPVSCDQFVERFSDLKTLRFLPEFIKINAPVTSEVAHWLTPHPVDDCLIRKVSELATTLLCNWLEVIVLTWCFISCRF